MRSASSGGWSRPVRWSLWLTAGAASAVSGLGTGLSAPRAEVG